MEFTEYNLEGIDDANERIIDTNEFLEKQTVCVFTHCAVSTHESYGYLMNYEVEKWVTSEIPNAYIAKIEDYAHSEIVVLRDNIDEPIPVNIPANAFKRVVTLTNGRKLFCL